MICGGLVKTTCSGDSGGPVVANINGQFTLIGLTSFGLKESCGTNVPGVYADVSYPDILKFIYSVDRLPGWIQGYIVTRHKFCHKTDQV